MFKKIRSFASICVAATCGLIWPQVVYSEPDEPPSSVVLVFSAHLDDDTAQVTLESFGTLVETLPKRARIQAFDGSNARRLLDVRVAPVDSQVGRKRAMQRQAGDLFRFLNRSRSVRSGQEIGSLDLPEVMAIVAGTVKREGGPTPRVVIIGSPYYQASKDEAMNFAPGWYLSDKHLNSEGLSNFDTSDRTNALDGVVVDWILLGDHGSLRDRRPVQRFWGHWFALQGATLSTFLPEPEVVIERVVAGVVDSVVHDELDATDTVIEKRRVGHKRSAPIKADEPDQEQRKVNTSPSEPVTKFEHTPIEVDVAFAPDGSGSQGHVLHEFRDMAIQLADLGSRLTNGFSLGLVVMRQPESHSIFPLTLMGSRRLDDQGDGDIRSFAMEERFYTTDRDGVATLRPMFAAVNIYVDLEDGLGRAIDMLEKGSGSRKVLVFSGDRAHTETDQQFGVSQQDIAAGERVLERLRAFVAANDARVVVVFTPPLTERDEPTVLAAKQWYKRAASVAGRHGYYTENLEDIESLVSRAALVE